jgi:pseudouridine synthase
MAERKTKNFMLIAFNKPFAVLSQFNSDQSPNRTLAEFGFPPGVYPVGRLDADSEGLLILSDQPEWNARLLLPGKGHEREYWVQVEGCRYAGKAPALEHWSGHSGACSPSLRCSSSGTRA